MEPLGKSGVCNSEASTFEHMEYIFKYVCSVNTFQYCLFCRYSISDTKENPDSNH